MKSIYTLMQSEAAAKQVGPQPEGVGICFRMGNGVGGEQRGRRIFFASSGQARKKRKWVRELRRSEAEGTTKEESKDKVEREICEEWWSRERVGQEGKECSALQTYIFRVRTCARGKAKHGRIGFQCLSGFFVQNLGFYVCVFVGFSMSSEKSLSLNAINANGKGMPLRTQRVQVLDGVASKRAFRRFAFCVSHFAFGVFVRFENACFEVN